MAEALHSAAFLKSQRAGRKVLVCAIHSHVKAKVVCQAKLPVPRVAESCRLWRRGKDDEFIKN
jgi:hypothetical protein